MFYFKVVPNTSLSIDDRCSSVSQISKLRSSARSISVDSCSKTKHPSLCGGRAVPGNQAETRLRREQWSAVASLPSDVKLVVESSKFHMAEIKFSIEMITDIFEIDCSVRRINGWCVKEDASNTLTWSLCATPPLLHH